MRLICQNQSDQHDSTLFWAPNKTFSSISQPGSPSSPFHPALWKSGGGLLRFCWLVINKPTGWYLCKEIYANALRDGGEAVCFTSLASIFNDVDFPRQRKTNRDDDGLQCCARPAGDSSGIFEMQTHTHTRMHRVRIQNPHKFCWLTNEISHFIYLFILILP